MIPHGATSRDIAQNIAKAAQRTGEMSASVRTVGDAAEATSNSAGELQQASDELRRQAAQLEQEMQAFMTRMRAA